MDKATGPTHPFNAYDDQFKPWEPDTLVMYVDAHVHMGKIQEAAMILASRQMREPTLVTDSDLANVRNKLCAVVYTRLAIHRMMDTFKKDSRDYGKFPDGLD
ncbi:hypothetical protein D3C78_768100 [compost metagenome]